MELPQTLTRPRSLRLGPGLVAGLGLAAVGLLLLLLQWHLWLRQEGLPLLDWDSSEQLYFCRLWAREYFFGNDRSWLPLFFALDGSLLRLLRRPLLCHAALNVALCLAGLRALQGILESLNPRRGIENLALLALAGLSLAFVENGLYARSDALFTCCVLWGTFLHLRRLERDSPAGQLLCVLFFSAAALTRFEGWAFAVCLAALSRSLPRPRLSLLVLLPVAVWLGYGWYGPHGPLSSLSDISRTAQAAAGGFDWRGLERLAAAVLLGSPLRFEKWMAAALSLAGLAVLCGSAWVMRRGALGRHFLILAWLPLLAIAGLAAWHGYPVAAEHMAVFQILLLACLAPLLGAFLRRTGLKAAAAALAAVCVVSLRLGLDRRPSFHNPGPPNRRLAGLLLEYSQGGFAPSDSVVVETWGSFQAGGFSDDPVVFRALAFPLRVVWAREEPSSRLVQDEGARLLILRGPDPAARLSPQWVLAGTWGIHRLLMRGDDRLLPGLAARLRSWARSFPEEAGYPHGPPPAQSGVIPPAASSGA